MHFGLVGAIAPPVAHHLLPSVQFVKSADNEKLS